MAGSQFVPMAVNLKDTNLFMYEGFLQRQAFYGDRDHLTGHRLTVFHARDSDILMRNL